MNLAIDPFAVCAGLFRRAPTPRRPAEAGAAALGPVAIGRQETAVVRDAARTRVACLRGSLWITHDGDIRDIVIAAGESHTSDRPGVMLVYGLERSVATIG